LRDQLNCYDYYDYYQWVNVEMNITVLIFLTLRVLQPQAGGRDPVNRRHVYKNIWHRLSENSLL
jgi:hypothetical protein